MQRRLLRFPFLLQKENPSFLGEKLYNMLPIGLYSLLEDVRLFNMLSVGDNHSPSLTFLPAQNAGHKSRQIRIPLVPTFGRLFATTKFRDACRAIP